MNRAYTLNLLKGNAAVCLHNYKEFGRVEYLNRAIAYTREALHLYRKGWV
jgi:hypothetical protein